MSYVHAVHMLFSGQNSEHRALILAIYMTLTLVDHTGYFKMEKST